MPESQNYVTNGHLNTVVYELKNEIRVQEAENEKRHMKQEHNTELLTKTLMNLSENIKENSKVMQEISIDLKDTKEEIGIIKVENISRDYILKDLEEFKDETAGKLSGRFGEVVKLVGIIATVFSGIIIAIINIAPALFG